MTKIEAIIRPDRLEELQHQLEDMGLTGLTVTEVRGAGRQAGYVERRREGRRNRYRLRVDLPLGDPVVEDGLLSDLLTVIKSERDRARADT